MRLFGVFDARRFRPIITLSDSLAVQVVGELARLGAALGCQESQQDIHLGTALIDTMLLHASCV